MDDAQALRIISALANGANPITGEVFPPDSPYQSPDIIRALFAAARALESKVPASQSSMHTQRQRNPAIGNAGKSWTAEEDRQLLAAFDAGKSLAELAQIHGRTQGGVRARLEKHGRLEPSPATRWPVQGKLSRNEPVRDKPRSMKNFQ
ncbi:MAG TPA: hypothetical protein VET48_00150 [Steroidobacteraceae bacterium]|nr:hypothetical protein [Steroidobacteraceae bacterium]